MTKTLPDPVKRIWLDNLKHSGIPLELVAQQKFIEKGFVAYNFNWVEEGKTNRELDVLATKEKKFDDECFNIKIDVKAIGSCAYRKDYAYFLFDETSPSIIQKFPIISAPKFFHYTKLWLINDLNFFPSIVGHTIKGCSISEKNLPSKDFTQSGIYDKSNDSLAFMQDRYTKSILSDKEKFLIDQIPYEISSIVQKFGFEKGISFSNKTDSIDLSLREKRSELLEVLKSKKPLIHIEIGFPIVITEGTIWNVKLDEKREPVDLQNVGFGLYLHRPRENDKWTILSGVPLLPVIVTEIRHLDKCIDIIEQVSDEVIKYFEGRLKSSGHTLILRDILEKMV